MQKTDRSQGLSWMCGRITFATTTFATMIGLLVVVVGYADGTDETAGLETPEAIGDVAEPKPHFPKVEVSISKAGEGSVGTASTGTWQWSSRESCWDLWMMSCAPGDWPSDQCPPDPAGQPCVAPDTCWHVIHANRADLYVCE